MDITYTYSLMYSWRSTIAQKENEEEEKMRTRKTEEEENEEKIMNITCMHLIYMRRNKIAQKKDRIVEEEKNEDKEEGRRGGRGKK